MRIDLLPLLARQVVAITIDETMRAISATDWSPILVYSNLQLYAKPSDLSMLDVEAATFTSVFRMWDDEVFQYSTKKM